MFQLSDAEQRQLLKIARTAVYTYLAGKAPRFPEITAGPLSETHGVFVSLHDRPAGELRGCIGNIHPTHALYRTTFECAISAAVGDPRFMSLTMEELPHVDFEISVLSALEKIESIDRIEVGRDGIFISKKGIQGLLLPQVATEYGWTRERFLTETCRKAGLKPGDWKEGATISRFSAHVFGEKKLQSK